MMFIIRTGLVDFESMMYMGSVTLGHCLNSMIWLNKSMICDGWKFGIDSIAMMSLNTNVNWL